LKHFIISLIFLSSLFGSIKDLKTIPQDFQQHFLNIPYSKISNKTINEFKSKYFYPWNIKNITISKKSAQWGNGYSKKKMYDENKKRLKKSWFSWNIDNSNFNEFNTIKEKAITIKETHLRVFPTDSRMYYNPSKPGEGYPFDYNQNSSLKVNIPLFVSHFSKDRKWVYVESNLAFGWLKTSDISFVKKETINKIKKLSLFVNMEDKNILFSNNKYQEFKMGTIFPIYKNKLLTINKNGSLNYFDINYYTKPLGLDLNINNIINITKNLINEPYGWGGIDNLRDCSLLVKDFFTPFGVFLPRNSKAQAGVGSKINLEGLSLKEKKDKIIKKAIPFKTILYMKGHIMLYVGYENNEPLVLHNFWGIRYKENGRVKKHVVGKAAITTLEPGKELNGYLTKSSLGNKLVSMSVINF